MNKKEITYTSVKNEHIKMLRKVLNNKETTELVVLKGLFINQVASSLDVEFEYVYVCEDNVHTKQAEQIIKECVVKAKKTFYISKETMESLVDKEKDQVIISLCKMKEYNLETLPKGEESILIIADGIEDAGNLGTIIRSADGMGADAVIVCNRRAKLTHPNTIKSSLGTIFKVPVIEADIESLKNWIKNNNYSIYLADTSSNKKYSDVVYHKKSVLIVGNERYGISKDWYNQEYQGIYIPMLGVADSLNVGVATSIIAYEMRRSLDCGGVK